MTKPVTPAEIAARLSEAQIETYRASFSLRFDKAGLDDCWSWNGHLDRQGYGHFGMFGINLRAQRAAFWLFVREPKAGLHIDHVCRNKSCVNPNHLREVPASINTLENSDAITAINAAKTHCQNGHEFVGRNVRIRQNGARVCRICAREYAVIWRKAKSLNIPVAILMEKTDATDK